MYLHVQRHPKSSGKSKTSRRTAKRLAKNRRRVNGMKGTALGRRIRRNG